MNIDAKTGLPELPEGYFWRVERSALSIMHTSAAGEWSSWSPHPMMYRDYSSYDERETREVEKPVLTWGMFDLGRTITVTEYRYRRAAINRTAYTKRYGEWEPVYGGDWRCMVADEITRQNLSERAAEALADWETNLGNAALLGDYPPKKFGGVS